MEFSSQSDTNVTNVEDLRSWNESPDIFNDDTYSEKESEPSKDNSRKMDANDGNRIRNCMNAFVNFTKRVRPYYKSKYPTETFYGITRRIGHRWASLPPSEKDRYISLSNPDVLDLESLQNGRSRHGDVTAGPRHNIPEVKSLVSADSSCGSVTAVAPRQCTAGVKSQENDKSRHGNVTAGTRHGNVTAGQIHGNVTAGPIHGDVTAGPRQGNVTAGPIHSNVTSGPRHGNVTAAQIHGNVTVGPRHGVVTAGSRQGNVTAGPRHSNVTSGPIHGNVPAGPINGNVTAGPIHGNVTAGRRHGNATAGPRHGNVTAGLRHGNVTAGPIHSDVIAGPGHGNVTAGPIHGNVTSGPIHSDVIAGPRHSNVTARPRYGYVTAGPRHGIITAGQKHDNVTAWPIYGDIVAGPRQGNVTAGPIHSDVTAGPRHSNVTAGPVHGNVTAGPRQGNVTAGPIHSDVTAGPRHSNITAGPVHGNVTVGPRQANVTAGPIHSNVTAGSIHSNVTAGPRQGNVTAGPKHSDVTAGQIHSYVTAGPRHGNVTAGPIHGNVTSGPIYSDAFAGPRHSNVTARPRHGYVTAGPRHGIVTAGPKHDNVTAWPIYGDIVAGPRHGIVTAGPKHDNVTAWPIYGDIVAVPRHGNVTAGPRHSNVTTGPIHSDVTAGPRQGNVTTGPIHSNVTAGPRQGNVTAGPVHGNVTAGPRQGNVTAGPIHGKVTAGPRQGNVTAGPIHSDVTAGPRHSNVTAGPVHGNVTAGPRQGNVTAGPIHSDVTAGPRHSNVTAGPVHGNVTAGPRQGNFTAWPIHSDVTAGPRHSNVTAGPIHGNVTAGPVHSDVTAGLTRNVTAAPRHDIAELRSQASADSRHGAGDSSSKSGMAGMYGRIGGNKSPKRASEDRIKSRDTSVYASDVLNWTHQRCATSQVSIENCPVNLSRSQSLQEVSSMPNATHVFPWAQNQIIGDYSSLKVDTTLLASTDDVTRGCIESKIIADEKRCSGTLSNSRGSSEARVTYRDKNSVLALPPKCTSTTVAIGWEYVGTSCTNVITSVFNKSSNISNEKYSQLSNFDNNNVCTSVSSCVRNHIDLKCNDGNNFVNSKTVERHKHNNIIYVPHNRHENKMCSKTESNSATKSKIGRRTDGVVSKLKAKRFHPKSSRASSAIRTNIESQMTGSVLFSSGVKMKYRKILPKPLNITVAESQGQNKKSLDQNPVQQMDFKKSLNIKDAHRKEAAIKSEHLYTRKQNEFGKSMKLLCPKDEVSAWIKRFIRETDDPVRTAHREPGEKITNGDTNCSMRCEGTQDLKNREPPICKTFGLKEDDNSAAINDKKNYNVLLTKWTDWDISPLGRKEQGDVQNNLRKKNDPISSSNGSLGDMDFLIEGCDSPMWFSSGSSAGNSPPCAGNTDLTDRTIGDCTDTASLLSHPVASQRLQTDSISSVDGTCLSDSCQQVPKGYVNGSPSHGNVSTSNPNGPGTSTQSDDIIAMQNLYQCSTGSCF